MHSTVMTIMSFLIFPCCVLIYKLVGGGIIKNLRIFYYSEDADFAFIGASLYQKYPHSAFHIWQYSCLTIKNYHQLKYFKDANITICMFYNWWPECRIAVHQIPHCNTLGHSRLVEDLLKNNGNTSHSTVNSTILDGAAIGNCGDREYQQIQKEENSCTKIHKCILKGQIVNVLIS